MNSSYHYPLHIRFRILTIGNQLTITDATNREIFYSEEKVFAIRESIKIYNNQEEKKQLYGIKTKKVFDFGAEYFFYEGTDTTSPFGSLKEEGLKSIIKAHYTIRSKDGEDHYLISETNPWIKVLDFAFSFIPYADFLTGFFFNPTYDVIDLKTTKPIMFLKKERSFWERQFLLELADASLSKEEVRSVLLGIIMMVLLQRARG